MRSIDTEYFKIFGVLIQKLKSMNSSEPAFSPIKAASRSASGTGGTRKRHVRRYPGRDKDVYNTVADGNVSSV